MVGFTDLHKQRLLFVRYIRQDKNMDPDPNLGFGNDSDPDSAWRLIAICTFTNYHRGHVVFFLFWSEI